MDYLFLYNSSSKIQEMGLKSHLIFKLLKYVFNSLQNSEFKIFITLFNVSVYT